MKFCGDCNKQVETYWELAYCDKNPEGLLTEPMKHGNEIDGTITCEDDYCNPGRQVVENPTEEYIKTHEVEERCKECDQYIY